MLDWPDATFDLPADVDAAIAAIKALLKIAIGWTRLVGATCELPDEGRLVVPHARHRPHASDGGTPARRLTVCQVHSARRRQTAPQIWAWPDKRPLTRAAMR